MSNLKLMIGDWVMCKGFTRMFQANEIFKNGIRLVDKFGRIVIAPYSNIQPIPLTPEILEKVEGCEKCFRIDNFGEYKECYEVVFALGLMIRHNSYYIDWIGGNTEVKYLHTLQQFIRLFTKKEIEIKW